MLNILQKITTGAVMLVLMTVSAAADDFVTTSGMKIIGRDGNPITLRGSNCGNWMVQEPYMMNTSGKLDRQYKFYDMMVEVMGKDKADEFDRLWMDNVFAESDMKFLADQGFNTLRVPMHYKYFTLPVEQEPISGANTWVEEGFTRIDRFVEWAEKYGILLILDMHACPGGQSSGDICDYDPSRPSLWESAANRSKLTALWRRIAQRYADEKCILGYDLINETNWSLPNSNQALWDLLRQLIAAVREVDKNHIVIVEGNSYSNDYTGFPSAKLDPKMVIQYHRYGVYNTLDQLSDMKANAVRHNCPVYVGEFGENSNTWDADAVRVMETGQQFAGWTQWPLKKSNMNTMLRVNRVAAYDNIITRWNNGQKPSATEMWNALKAWAEAQAFDNCTIATDYIDALLRRPFDRSARPYSARSVNDYIFAAQYDMGPIGIAYHDDDDASYQYNGEDFTNWQQGWIYRNDGVDIESGVKNEPVNCGYNVGWTADGEWMQYTIDNPHDAATWSLELRYALNSGSSVVSVSVNGREVVPPTALTATGSHTTWATRTFNDIVLPKGSIRVRLHIRKGGANFNWMHFTDRRTATAAELKQLDPPVHGEQILTGGDCASPDPWYRADVGAINSMRLLWNWTSSTPANGTEGSLKVESKRGGTSNVVIYQPVEVKAGHTYKADVAFRAGSGAGDFWAQAFITANEPVDYHDNDLKEDNTIGQLNSWIDTDVTTLDGMMSTKAVAGKNHLDGTMTWKATESGTRYFALKIGSNKYPFSAMLDNFTLTDLDFDAGIDDPLDDNEPIFTLSGRRLDIIDGALVHDIQGRAINAGYVAPGIYIVSFGSRNAKVVVK